VLRRRICACAWRGARLPLEALHEELGAAALDVVRLHDEDVLVLVANGRDVLASRRNDANVELRRAQVHCPAGPRGEVAHQVHPLVVPSECSEGESREASVYLVRS